MNNIKSRLKTLPWKRILLGLFAVAIIALLTVQFLYSSDRVLPSAMVKGVSIGGLSRDEATKVLNDTYKNVKLAVYFGDAKEPYRSPTLAELGVSVDSVGVIESRSYPVWLRFVPTSLWWGHTLTSDDADINVSLHSDALTEYTNREFGESCNIKPKNATIILKDSVFSLSPAADGGQCKNEDIIQLLSSVDISELRDAEVRVPLEGVKPTIPDTTAQDLIDTIETQIKDRVDLKFEDQIVKVDASAVRSWISFSENKDKIDMKVDSAKVTSVINERILSIPKAAGTVTVKMTDGKETSRSGKGTEGRMLNINATVENVTQYLLGKKKEIMVATSAIKPTYKYVHSYSTTTVGFSAMLKRFADSTPGEYGVSIVELSGKRRTAGYNENKNFFPASTYKLFVAFSVLKRVENGTYKWTDKKVGNYKLPGGRNVSSCFDTMIIHSDNACPETFRKAITYGKLNDDLRSIGIYNTTFIAPGEHLSTARDLTSFLVKLETGGLPINGASKSKLLSAMRSNVFRQGVPAGASGPVANKVGFIWELLHDVAIVYSPNGTYVVTIMTDNSSWATIAKLTREIEEFRKQ